MRRWFVLAFLAALAVSSGAGRAAAASDPPLLLGNPTVSRTEIAFTYGGDIWIVARHGGEARRLVTGYHLAASAYFSPDGSQLAFTASYDGNNDVYVVASSGGEPRRLTFHPSADVAVGWTPDGKRVLFRSNRTSYSDPDQLYTIPTTGGVAAELPLPMAETGSYSADGTHLAYVPDFQWEPFWKGYRGGQTTYVLIANLADSSTVAVPRNGSNDNLPMWVGDRVYFLSDRDGPITLFAYDTRTRKVEKLIKNESFDITSASAGPDAIAYSQFGVLHLYDIASGRSEPVHVTVAADLTAVRPHWENAALAIQNAGISPNGVRAVFEAHGDILTVPVEQGGIRNITKTTGVEERDPSWSPDGKWIAYFSDASGEYTLNVRDQRGLEPARVISLGPSPTYYYSPVWSPDSKKIAYSDKRLNLWYVDLDHPTPVKVATGPYGDFGPTQFAPDWSPDSRWLAYTAQLDNFLHAAFVYSLDGHSSHRVTDGMSDVGNAVFDKNGKYLYFTASVNTALTANGLDMEADGRITSNSVYAAVLRRDLPSPLSPQTADEETKGGPDGAQAPEPPAPSPSPAASKAPAATAAAAAAAAKAKFGIDLDGILQRIVALPIEEANYFAIGAGKPGELFLFKGPLAQVDPGPPSIDVELFDLKSRKAKPIVAGTNGAVVAADGDHLLYTMARRWFIVPTSQPVHPGAGALATQTLEVYVEPRKEWAQMYHEAWRIQREFFYDPHFHGLDIDAAEKRFEPYLAGLSSRDDLTFLMREMLSYVSVGHMFVNGPPPQTRTITVGLLGADYRVENDRYRISKIFDGENWNPDVQAPLTQPGTNVKVGEYVLAVNGRSVTASQEIYSYFEETAGKQTTIRVGPNADGSGARDVVVVPVRSEARLRNLDWIESNRRKVDQLSGGKLAYVYLPDTGGGGFTNFNRYFFSQIGKQGIVIDERFNHGGQIADYIIDLLGRKPMGVVVSRQGKTTIDPPLAIYGPKVMVINEFAGSGGDAMPWYFRKAGLGPLVGTRTWGGLVGIGGYPPLMDGGSVTSPRAGIGGLHGQWEIEGHGIAPDIEVWQDPKLVREGHDPQLEAAVSKAMQLLAAHPVPTFHQPPFPDHHPVLPPP
jgi:tricorn protease